MGKKESTYIVTAPSGTGKTTLNRRLVEEQEDVAISISLTTRTKRHQEVDGDHYWFVSKKNFFQKIEKGGLLEWAEVFGHFYGTSFDEISRIHSLKKRALLEIDVQGWKQAREKLPEAVSIFMMPPSMKTLWERLESRGTDSIEVRQRRIKTARQELDQGNHYQYFVVNDDLDQAFTELKTIFEGKKPLISQDEGLRHCHRLQDECKEPWFSQLSGA